MNSALLDYYRCPETVGDFALTGNLSGDSGYFQFGPDVICYGHSTDLWKRQVARIMEAHGLASFIVHPDYLIEARARDTYKSLLAYLDNLRSEGQMWLALPREVNDWWRARSQMKLVRQGNNWVIEGPENDRARVAYAVLDGGRLAYVPVSHQASVRRMACPNGQTSSTANREPGVLTEDLLRQTLPLGLEAKINEQIF